jgi:transcriptional regulator with XRE-family HTH domain
MIRKYKKWTTEEKDLARQLLSQFTIKQVSRKLNRSIGSVKEMASNEMKENYCRSKLYRQIEGTLQSEIAKKLGVSRSHINNWIKMNNLIARKCGKKGFLVIEEESLLHWLRDGYMLLPMLNPPDEEFRMWLCEERYYFLQNYISSIYIREIAYITRGALDNWIRNFSFPPHAKKIGKLGFFFNRKEVIAWARENSHVFPMRRIVSLCSYEQELDYLNGKMKYKCFD